MQAKNHDGSFGKVMELNQENLDKEFRKPATKHIEVFEATEENIKFRNKLSVKKRFQKTGSNKK